MTLSSRYLYSSMLSKYLSAIYVVGKEFHNGSFIVQRTDEIALKVNEIPCLDIPFFRTKQASLAVSH